MAGPPIVWGLLAQPMLSRPASNAQLVGRVLALDFVANGQGDSGNRVGFCGPAKIRCTSHLFADAATTSILDRGTQPEGNQNARNKIRLMSAALSRSRRTVGAHEETVRVSGPRRRDRTGSKGFRW